MVRIAIVGAGVGGLTLARALYRLDVQNVTVFERRTSASRQVDRGLGLWDDSQVKAIKGIRILKYSRVKTFDSRTISSNQLPFTRNTDINCSKTMEKIPTNFAGVPQGPGDPDRPHRIQHTPSRLQEQARHVAVSVFPDPRESVQGTTCK